MVPCVRDSGSIGGIPRMDSPTKSLPVSEGESPVARVPASFYWALGAVVGVFGAVRFACLFNDLWLDEIWSLRLVEQLKSPAEILTRLWHDNNHPLNSLWLYLLGPGRADWTYRLLSWFMGTLTVGLAGLIGRQQFQRLHPGAAAAPARSAGIITAILVGGSYFLIHYSSEARGYAPAVGFGFLAIYALGHSARRATGGWAVVYGLSCGLGLLAHLVTFQVMLAGLVWSVAQAWRNWSRWRDRLVHLACWHLGPWIFLGIYYLSFVRKIEIGGGPKLPLGDVLGTLAAFSLGFPNGMGAWIALVVFLGATLLALMLLWRRDRATAVFYAAGIFVAPALGLCSSRFVLLYPRYFIVSAALGLLLAGYLLARLWNSGGLARWASVVLLGGLLAGNDALTVRLLRDGRGQYQAALHYIAERSPPGTITVSSDSDFRNFAVMDYYAKAVGPGHTLRYFASNQLPPEGPQWIFVHRLDETTPVPGPELNVAGRWQFQLGHVFPHAPLSGYEWYVYRNLDPSVLPAMPR